MTVKRRAIFRALAAFAFALLLIRFSAPAWAEDTQIVIKDFAFAPKELTVAAGTTITWVNRDDEAHQLMSQDKVIHSAALDTDDKASITFKDPGTYSYFCTLHPQMTGTIVVK